MNAREYYSQIETTINDCPIVTHFSTEFDEIDQFVGYFKGKLDLMDGSILHFIEFIEIENEIVNRLKYKYHWQSENGELIERWDNVPHHREIDTFPHHKHDNKGVYSSSNVNLKTIIDYLMDKLLI